jgi:membrane protein implicated in regulation of membrane protease activity
MFGVGFGVITVALFPLAIPALAVLALFALPLLPLAIPAILLIPVWLVARAVSRRLSRRARSGPGRAGALGPQAGQSR